jgi:hypothetical protein
MTRAPRSWWLIAVALLFLAMIPAEATGPQLSTAPDPGAGRTADAQPTCHGSVATTGFFGSSDGNLGCGGAPDEPCHLAP